MDIEFCGAERTYERKIGRKRHLIPALAPVSFTIKSGEFFTIIGPSGCGKSTLLNLLAGLDHPSNGEVKIEGAAVSRPKASWRHGVMAVRLIKNQDVPPTSHSSLVIAGHMGKIRPL
ncbi:ATP-binding cassette domain-containing protein [Candidatus Sumerlaeota bacterium]|nr:ATP-binding cassette domain-containing protein [Candidatus Sumerlaeota bacterium]MBI3735817.1 ATP-binding cassette domain-containing protein [Candidatus Sumerlaeota bacterium]